MCVCWWLNSGWHRGGNTQRAHTHTRTVVVLHLSPRFTFLSWEVSSLFHNVWFVTQRPGWSAWLLLAQQFIRRWGWGVCVCGQRAASLKSNSRDNGHYRRQITDNVSSPLRPRISTGLWPLTPAVNRYQLSTAHPLWCAWPQSTAFLYEQPQKEKQRKNATRVK